MSETPPEEDAKVQVGSIMISLFMEEGGTSMGYQLDGVDPEAAIGHLGAVTRRIERAIDAKWGDADDDGIIGEVEAFHFTCPSCEEEVDVPLEDMNGFTTTDGDDFIEEEDE